MATKKATTKKIVKKPMMKKGGIKKPLRKAQNGEPVYSGPFTEAQTKRMDKAYPSTVTPVGSDPWKNTKTYLNSGFNVGEDPVGAEKEERASHEQFLRKINKLKKGGRVKKYQDGGEKGRVKSKKVRSIDINRHGPSSASVSKTKKDGTTVTKKVNASRGFAPTASMSKTVTSKEGKVISEQSKPIGYNKAVRKMTRIGNNVGRNENDTYSYKKGGAMKKMKTGGMVNPNAKLQAAKSAASKGVKSGINPRAAASKVARGRSGGTSTAPKTAVPKAKYGMSMKKK